MPAAAYSKKPVPVPVNFATEDGVLQTLEGPVAYKRGDALATGVAGERWPIARARFERTYRPADAGGVMGSDGCFIKLPVVVEAVCLEDDRRIPLPGGRGVLEGKPGDWLVTAPDGEAWIVAASVFGSAYTRADPSAG